MMSKIATADRTATSVTIWLDPVCPFSWNTARWLAIVADKAGIAVDWQLMSLAILNEGRDLPAPQQARMRDSRHVGRLMTAIRHELGAPGMVGAYFAFAERYFEHSVPLDDHLAQYVLESVNARETSAASLADTGVDPAVLQSHQASQEALGETGGSPMLSIDSRAFFGPVLTTLPSSDTAVRLFDAVVTLATTPEFSQLQRPRAHT
jgi:hypothetical protein